MTTKLPTQRDIDRSLAFALRAAAAVDEPDDIDMRELRELAKKAARRLEEILQQE